MITDMTRSLKMVDINIDILDGYIRTPEVFQKVLDKTGVREGLPEPPGELMGHIGPWWRERGVARAGHAPPPPWVQIGLGKGGGAPLSFSLSLSFVPPLSLLVESY